MKSSSFHSGQVSLTMEAPAKVNILLKILGRRADGYHELESLMQKVSLVDTLHLQRLPAGICLSCPGSGVPEDSSNLASRAAELFFEETGTDGGVEIVLEKRIPVAAGLGGGSSDAAAVLRGLDRLYGTGLAEEALFRLGRRLGADVNFFIAGHPAAWATGIGDRLEPAPALRNFWMVLVNPGFAVSTKWVYDTLALTSKGNPYILATDTMSGKLRDSWPLDAVSWLANDLEQVTIRQFPEIQTIKEGLSAAGAVGTLMSGSGPTVFGLFTDRGLAERARQRFASIYGNVFLATPLAEGW